MVLGWPGLGLLFSAARDRRWALSLAVLSLLLTSGASPESLPGQEKEIRLEADFMQPSDALRRLEVGQNVSEAILAAFTRDRVVQRPDGGVTRRVGHYRRYSAAQRREFLDGLERIARGEVEGGDRAVIRAVGSAMEVLGALLQDPDAVAPEIREIPRRLVRIYEAPGPVQAKVLAMRHLGYLLASEPPEQRTIIQLLTAAAAAPPEGVVESIPIEALLSGCRAGVPALRLIHRRGLVSDPTTVAWLRGLVESGFPVEEMETLRGAACPGKEADGRFRGPDRQPPGREETG